MTPYFSKVTSSAPSILFFGHINVALPRGLCIDVLPTCNTRPRVLQDWLPYFIHASAQTPPHIGFRTCISHCCLSFVFFKAYHYLSSLLITFFFIYYFHYFLLYLFACFLHSTTNMQASWERKGFYLVCG